MGTGKSTVGRLVATKLQRDFMDMDALIEQREGRSINQIFKDKGENYFRRLEADFCRELAEQQDLVIATGGGALINADNRRTMMVSGTVVPSLSSTPSRL